MTTSWTSKWMLQPVRRCCKGSQLARVAPAEGFIMKITRTRLKQIIKEELDRASEIKAERVVNFIKGHGDTHAELVHQDDGSMKIKVVTKVYDTNTRKMSSEVNYIEPTMQAARRILDY